jgi:hypothetical protein
MIAEFKASMGYSDNPVSTKTKQNKNYQTCNETAISYFKNFFILFLLSYYCTGDTL